MLSIIFTLIGICITTLVASWCYSFIKWCWKSKIPALASNQAEENTLKSSSEDEPWTNETLEATLQSMAEKNIIAMIAADAALKSLFNSMNKAINTKAKK